MINIGNANNGQVFEKDVCSLQQLAIKKLTTRQKVKLLQFKIDWGAWQDVVDSLVRYYYERGAIGDPQEMPICFKSDQCRRDWLCQHKKKILSSKWFPHILRHEPLYKELVQIEASIELMINEYNRAVWGVHHHFFYERPIFPHGFFLDKKRYACKITPTREELKKKLKTKMQNIKRIQEQRVQEANTFNARRERYDCDAKLDRNKNYR